MSRHVDHLPEPREVKKMKVIVASASRTGTMGLYRAMQILGYDAYHAYECIVGNGIPHMKTLEDAVTAHHNRLSGVRKYEREDFDRWLANYDCIVEVGSWIGKDLIEAYKSDPEIKFILTERNPRKWAISVNNTAGKLVQMATSFPMSTFKNFDPFLYQFLSLNVTVYKAFAGSTMPGDPENLRLMEEYYVDYIKMVKETVPADRLCVIQLEDGLDWNSICPFLGIPVPDAEYPDRNEPERFQALVQATLGPKINAAILRFSAVTVPVLGVLGWMGMKYGPVAWRAMTNAVN